MTLPERLLEILDETIRCHRLYPKLRERLAMIRRQVDLASMTPAPTIFARIDNAQIECPRCHHLMEVLRGRRGRLRGWDALGRILTCQKCAKCYTPAVVLYPKLYRATERAAAGIPPDHLGGEAIRAQQIQLGYFRPERHWKRQKTNIVMAEGCLCTPGEWREGGNPQCPQHGKG